MAEGTIREAAADDRVTRYQRGVLACYQAAALLAEHDLAQLLGDAELAQAVGPVLDPTLWRERTKALGEDVSALRAALPLHSLGRRLRVHAGLSDRPQALEAKGACPPEPKR